MAQVVWLGVLLGIGAAFAVGPIFVTIVQQAATRGIGAAARVILGSATADLLLLVPTLAVASVVGTIAGAVFWIGLIGAATFLLLGRGAARDAWQLWHSDRVVSGSEGWAFWKGLLGNLANPLSWTFWLATGTPTMLRAREAAGTGGMVAFTATWFVVASGLELVLAVVVASSGRLIGRRGQAAFTATSAVIFVVLACNLLLTDVLPRL